MIGANTSLFGSMPDATSVELERTFAASTTSGSKMDSSIASAFMGSNETQTADFAQALGAVTQTDGEPTYGTADLAHALGRENEQAPTNVTSAPEFQEVYGLAEQASAKDALDLAAVQQEIVLLKADLQAKVLEAQAQNAGAVPEEAKILMAQETGTEAVYYANFLHRLIQSVERALKSMRQIMTNSAGHSASWSETKIQHNRQRDEQRLHAQAAG